MTYKKKLIEVALPLVVINRGCEEDKNRKTGHIRNLHKWFAPMPLPAWRAMLFASLIDDPGEHLPEADAAEERQRLFNLLERLSEFAAHKDEKLMVTARNEIAHAVGDAPPIVVDPFCGGGSTILEAQRLGLSCQASDLNPIPVLITAVLCRAAPLFERQGPVCRKAPPKPIGGWRPLEGMKIDISHYAHRVRDIVRARLEPFYPEENGTLPYAYRWAWAVPSPDPSVKGLYTPLVSDWWLSRRSKNKAWIQAEASRKGIEFSVRKDGEPPKGNTGRSGARCLYSDAPIPLEYIRSQGRAGRLRQVMFAVATRRGKETIFLAPSEAQLLALREIPDIENTGIIMPEAALGFRVQQYGIKNFRDLFTQRQAFALDTFAREVRAIHDEVLNDAALAGLSNDAASFEEGGRGARSYADIITAILGLCVSKMAQSNSILCRWFIDPRNGSGKATPAFDRHAVPMVWDFVETNPFGGSVGDWCGPVMETLLKAFDLHASNSPPAEVFQGDARDMATYLPSGALLATDPPYYANIGYADLSDFFYLWLREVLRPIFPNLVATVATPKTDELIATPYRHDGDVERANDYFRKGFTDVFASLAKRTDPRFPILIVYAIKQAEESESGIRSTGWEVFLGGLLDAGLSVVATWPMRTTTDTRMIGIGTNALASAIFVIGRPRPENASSITRSQFIKELRSELPKSLVYLQRANIAPVDLAQAAIGPGMSVYSRYAKVLDAEGNPVSVGEALALVNQILDEVLAEQEGDFDADTRFALTWFDQSGFAEGEFGVADVLARAKNTSVQGLVDAGVLVSGRGKARLLKPAEFPEDWDPATDARLTTWEIVHHLIRVLEAGGEGAAAALVAKLGSKAETARELCYRLYTVCERKKRATEALSYNALVQSFPEIIRLAREGGKARPVQGGLFDPTEE